MQRSYFKSMINNIIISSVAIGLLLTSTCGQKNREASSDTVSDTVQQNTSDAMPEATEVTADEPDKTWGIVSHKFMNKGCPTVILVAQNEGDTLVLIPRDALMQDYDVDGLQIAFNYRLLKMHSMPGCDNGMPAEITGISKE